MLHEYEFLNINTKKNPPQKKQKKTNNKNNIKQNEAFPLSICKYTL